MSETNSLRKASQLIDTGKREEASRILLALYAKTGNRKIRLQAIVFLVDLLDPIQQSDLLIEMCNEGKRLTTSSQLDTATYLMAKEASFLMISISLLTHEKQNIVLAPGWLNFSSEADKALFEKLTTQINNREQEVERLIGDSLRIAKSFKNRQLECRVRLMVGEIYMRKYLNAKMAYSAGNPRVRWFSKYLFNRFNLDHYLLYRVDQRRELTQLRRASTKNLTEAVRLARVLGDDSLLSHTLYNTANDLRVFNHFREAKRHLVQSKSVAEKRGDVALLGRIHELGRSISRRNRDIPDELKQAMRQ